MIPLCRNSDTSHALGVGPIPTGELPPCEVMAGSNRPYGVFVIFVIAAFSGCADDSTTTLPITDFTTWKIPADGTRIPAPRALHTAPDDTVYALDDAGRVLVYSSDGELQRTWRMPDYDTGRPEGIVELLDGRVAVADTHYHRVVFFHRDGTVESMLGDQGTDAGQFVYPVAIAQDPSGDIYVGEYGDRQRIQKFSSDGEFITQFGEHGSGPGQFQRPSGIVWHDQIVYAVDAFNNRVQAFTDSGEFLHVIKSPDNSTSLEFPYDVRATSSGNLIIVENKAARITVMKPNGTIVGRYGSAGRSEGHFFAPWSLTVMSDGRILVADTGNHRIVQLNKGAAP